MDEIHLFFISLLSIVFLTLLFKLLMPRKRRNVAPSPPSLPIIGHLHLIKGPVHRALHDLSSKYGPVMALRFGSQPVLIVTTSSAVEECFTRNDIVLANRPYFINSKYLDYNNTSLSTAPYGGLWRDLRRIAMLELFSTARLNSYLGIRQNELRLLIKSLFQEASQDHFTRVAMMARLQGLSYNVIMRIIADKRVYGTEVEDLEEARNFANLIREIFEISSASNPGNFIPFLQWIDFQGVEKKLQKLHIKTDCFAHNLIDERRRKRQGSSNKGKTKTFIDAMLNLQESEPEYYTNDILKANVLVFILAGTDTSSATIEWAMSLLLNHPDKLKRARAEVDERIGHKRLVEETDIPNLPYIQCIIQETLRLFPPAPLLLPHVSSEDCMIGGFNVSGGTLVFVNAWGVHRNPQLWDEPLSFKPERFEKMENIGYRFIPFGMGRRQCPGAGLANRVVTTALASLIQCFEWERVGEEMVDLKEGKGLTMPKDEPLEAMCKVGEKMSHVLREL